MKQFILLLALSAHASAAYVLSSVTQTGLNYHYEYVVQDAPSITTIRLPIFDNDMISNFAADDAVRFKTSNRRVMLDRVFPVGDFVFSFDSLYAPALVTMSVDSYTQQVNAPMIAPEAVPEPGVAVLGTLSLLLLLKRRR